MRKIFAMLALCVFSGVVLFADEPAGKAAADGVRDGKGEKMKGMVEHQKAMSIEYLKTTDPAKYEELKKLKDE